MKKEIENEFIRENTVLSEEGSGQKVDNEFGVYVQFRLPLQYSC